MSENEIWAAYEKRLLRVSAYIYEHLDEEFDSTRRDDRRARPRH